MFPCNTPVRIILHMSSSRLTCCSHQPHVPQTLVYIYEKLVCFQRNWLETDQFFVYSNQLRLRRVRTMASVTSAADATATMNPAMTITFEPVLACLVAVFVIVTSVESRSTATT